MRPDGRLTTPQTLALRAATRALRLHLDTLPIDVAVDVPGDRFLAGLAFMFARQRYDCAESMIGAGFGGTVLGSMARSLLVDGLRWLWIGEQPQRRRTLLGDLLEERNRICIAMDTAGASCPILARWLMPLPAVADLTGQSLTWLDAPPMPTEDQLLDDLLAPAAGPTVFQPGTEPAVPLRQARKLLDMVGLRGAAMVLAHAGHGNHLGLLSSLTDDGVAGHDLRADHEALFMQVAAAGIVTTLLGTTAAIPESWPPDVDQERYLRRAVELATDVAAAAVPIHGLTTTRAVRHPLAKTHARPRQPALLRPQAVLTAEDLLPDVNTAVGVATAAEAYYQEAGSMAIRPWDYGSPILHSLLTYGGAHSGLQTVISTYDQPGSAVISAFAARMLLEEAARLLWRYSDPAIVADRAKQYFDEYRARQKKTINTLVNAGVPKAAAERIFERPNNVRIVTPDDEIAKGRTPLPPIGTMLRQMGAPFPEPGWLEMAYSLLSQITHSTPVGHLHTVRFSNGTWLGNELSPEMQALALDVACLGSAHLIGLSAAVLTDLSEEARTYREALLRSAADVHDAARMVHGLD
jgi:hypothetical protein